MSRRDDEFPAKSRRCHQHAYDRRTGSRSDVDVSLTGVYWPNSEPY